MVAHTLAPNPVSQAEMLEWKRLVAEAVRLNQPLELRYFGGANPISGYRLFYMLQFAKRAGARRVSLHSDGLFWIDEATEWLVESEVDEIVLEVAGGMLSPALAQRVSELAAAGSPSPTVVVRPKSN
jgi:MoaA/NifB/PqqE/SkfB family radical SAM enzyme